MLIACRECGKDLSSEAEVCPHCGFNGNKAILKKEESEKAWREASLFSKILVFGIVLSPFFFIGKCIFDHNSDSTGAKVHYGDCVNLGISYFREIGSYPKLSTGKDAETEARRRCSKSTRAFGPF